MIGKPWTNNGIALLFVKKIGQVFHFMGCAGKTVNKEQCPCARAVKINMAVRISAFRLRCFFAIEKEM